MMKHTFRMPLLQLIEQKLGRWQVILNHLGSQKDPIDMVELNIITSVTRGRQVRDL